MKDTSAVERPALAWHGLTIQEAIERLETHGRGGLPAAVAADRLARFGPNRLPAPPRRPAWLRLAHQFHNVLIYVMLAAAAITLALGHLVDTAVLLAAVVINAAIGFVQEGKAERALDAIGRMLSLRATVIRDGERRDVPAEELVPGDLVALASGDKVPADLRLVSEKALRVNEAILTGESEVVEKALAPVPPDTALGDRRSLLYSGTLISSGLATGVVVATGADSELGRIGSLLGEVRSVTTPLLRQIDTFGRWLATAILLLCTFAFVLGVLWRGETPSEMFLMAVALAASAIPEGLPAIMTITLAMGVQRMARRNAIIRQLPAVEALGSVTVICSDKTGTLTRNEMTVQRVVCAEQIFDVDGVGYAPQGEISLAGKAVEPAQYPALDLAVRAGVLCNDGRLRQTDGQWYIEGDPTEGALLALGGKLGFTQDNSNRAWPRHDSIPFESEHRFMATLHQDAEAQPWIFVKGAPERILDMCSQQLGHDGNQPLDVDYWRRMATDIAARGWRLLAVACKQEAPGGMGLELADVESGYSMLALVGIIDPPREEAIQAVSECHRAGIRVKMITGDHAETARAIGALLGIGVDKPAITGAELALMDDAALRRVVMEVDIFARASPEQKLRLVRALQDDGQVVAMTGDGVRSEEHTS